MKPEDRKRLKQHIEMIVEHKEPDVIVQENFKKLQDEVADLREKNIKLRLELSTLRFKEAEEQRFIWWIWNVYSRNVNDLILSIISATTYDNETMAKLGKYGLPKKCFEIMERVKEGTDIIYGSDRIYDGTYLNVEISADVKKGIPENKPEPSNSDVSMTQDVLIDNKTPQSVEIEKLQIRLSEWRDVAMLLVDELNEAKSKQLPTSWEDASVASPAYIAYRNLVDVEDDWAGNRPCRRSGDTLLEVRKEDE